MSMAVTDNGGTKMHLYGYDKTYQVTEVNYPVGYEYLATDTTYNYDAVGNRISVIDDGGTTSYTTNALNQYTAVGGATYVYDDNGNLTYDGGNMIFGYDPENRLTTVSNIDGQLSVACDIDLTFTTDSNAPWFLETEEYYYDNDAVQSGDIDDSEETWLETTVTGSGYLYFYYKVSAQSGDEFTLFVDGQYKYGRSGSQDWTQYGPVAVSGSGTHTIRWRYRKDSSGSSGQDCVWVDYVRWTGVMLDEGVWGQIEYVYDPAGRRIEKKVDGTTELKFLYDGGHIIAEYDANDTLLRKYVHGPCTDEPICMIESSGTYAGTQYYHYDALGSVVALTDPNGDVVQLYEYSVWGQVAASDANHPNRFMFTGREFDKDTGLYYYRARYYHPEIGRFLQTDAIGYGDGVNWYTYCGNNALNCIDPSGMTGRFLDTTGEMLRYQTDEGEIIEFMDFGVWIDWFMNDIAVRGHELSAYAGYRMAGGDTDFSMKEFGLIQAMIAMGYDEGKIRKCDEAGITLEPTQYTSALCWNLDRDTLKIYFDPAGCGWTEKDQTQYGDAPHWWSNWPVLAMLAHEVEHGYEYAMMGLAGYSQDFANTNSASLEAMKAEQEAMMAENAMAYAFYMKVPGYRKGEIYETKGPRTFFSLYRRQVNTTGQPIAVSDLHSYVVLSMSWEDWSPDYVPEF